MGAILLDGIGATSTRVQVDTESGGLRTGSPSGCPVDCARLVPLILCYSYLQIDYLHTV